MTHLGRYRLSERCVSVRSSEVPVLDIEKPRTNACTRISAEVEKAIAEDRAEAIVLVCAGRTGMAADDAAWWRWVPRDKTGPAEGARKRI